MSSQPQPGFDQGRLDALIKIRDLSYIGIEKHTDGIVQDYMGTGVNPDVLEQIANAVEPTARLLQQQLTLALDNLMAGETVLAMTGGEPIKTYRPITGGDYYAGYLSAIEDYYILLLSLNTNLLTQPYSREVVGKFTGETAEKIAQSVRYSNAVIIDTIILRIDEKLRAKAKRPATIGYNGEEPTANRRTIGKLFNSMGYMVHPLTRFAYRAQKVEKKWPPLKAGPSAMANPGAHTASLPADTPAGAVDPLADTPNNNADFCRGFRDTLSKIHTNLQNEHFNAAFQKKNYAATTGLRTSWESVASATAQTLFVRLRQDIQRKFSTPVTGTGATYDDGVKAAHDWTANQIRSLTLTGTQQQVYAAKNIKDFWIKISLKP